MPPPRMLPGRSWNDPGVNIGLAVVTLPGGAGPPPRKVAAHERRADERARPHPRGCTKVTTAKPSFGLGSKLGLAVVTFPGGG